MKNIIEKVFEEEEEDIEEGKQNENESLIEAAE